MGAKLIQVIEVEETRGKGTHADPTRGVAADPCRIVKVYYSPDGKKLAEYDDWAERNKDLGKNETIKEG